jgi:hypothetical protein
MAPRLLAQEEEELVGLAHTQQVLDLEVVVALEVAAHREMLQQVILAAVVVAVCKVITEEMAEAEL